MQWSDINFAPPSKTLRQFALLWIAFFGGLATWQEFVHGHRTAALVLAAIALTMGPLGVLKPQALRLIFVAWTVLAFPIGWVVSKVLLGSVFYGVFTPIALLFRLTGRDALALRPQPAPDTY